MINQIVSNLSKKNVKTYFLFLIFTAFLWCALQFSKNYSKEINFSINYTKVDKDQFVKSNSDKEVNLTLEGNGFQLLKFFVFNKKLDLDVRRAMSKSPQRSYFTGPKMLSIIKESLGYTGNVTFSSKDTLSVYFSTIINKSVPVKIKQSIELESGYIATEGVVSNQKNITVEGPEVLLDTLKFIETEELTLKNLKKNYEGNLSLNFKKMPRNLKIKQKSIAVSIEVDKITEEEFKVPIEITHLKKNQRVQLFPKEVSVIFGVALKNYPKLKKSDFSVAVDMRNANPQSSKLALKLVKSPGLAYNVRLSEKEVQFIVIK